MPPEIASDIYEPVMINPSPDKYTWYIKDYAGKNIASFGYTSLGGDRRDSYGATSLALILVMEDGSYIDIEDENLLKELCCNSPGFGSQHRVQIDLYER